MRPDPKAPGIRQGLFDLDPSCNSSVSLSPSGYNSPMVASPAPRDTERDIELAEVPAAQAELEPPYRSLIYKDDATPFDE